MYDDACVLTPRDLAILKEICSHCGPNDPLLRLLRRKVGNATVVLNDDLPENVATIGSRIRFQVGDGASETRVLSQNRMNLPVGMFLPITSERGVALLGMSAGQVCMIGEEQCPKPVRLLNVLYQPQAARRTHPGQPAPLRERPRLRLVSGGMDTPVTSVTGGDDPGPSAA